MATKEEKELRKKKEEKKRKKEVPFSFSWFKPADVLKEIKRIRWQSPAELATDSGKVIVFVVLFAIFFVVCSALISKLLLLIGVGI